VLFHHQLILSRHPDLGAASLGKLESLAIVCLLSAGVHGIFTHQRALANHNWAQIQFLNIPLPSPAAQKLLRADAFDKLIATSPSSSSDTSSSPGALKSVFGSLFRRRADNDSSSSEPPAFFSGSLLEHSEALQTMDLVAQRFGAPPEQDQQAPDRLADYYR
jgi:hypothetical protein